MASMKDLQRRYGTKTIKSRVRADQSRERFREGVEGFDPRAYMGNAANALFANLSDQYQGQVAQIDQRNNARGFYHSPVGRAGARRTFDDYLGRGLAGLSAQAAGMEQNRLGMLGTIYGMDRGDRQFHEDAEIGLTMTREQQKLQDKASKRSMWGNIIGGIGSIAGATIMASDERLKLDVEDIPDVLPRAKRLKGKSWGWNKKGRKVTGEKKGQRRAGVMAQNVEQEFPELVREDEDGTKRVDYGGLVGVMAKALDEMDAKIERIGAAGSALVTRAA